MSLRCRRVSVFALAAVVVALVGGCERERREYRSAPESGPTTRPRLTDFQPGTPITEIPGATGARYEGNAFHINQGARWFRWFNCNGCHGAGGGAMGPALMDDQWRYGGRIDQIHATILDGRPNGMPAWRGKLTEQQMWQIAAYVRTLSGQAPKDAVSARTDETSSTPPATQTKREPTRPADSDQQ